MKEEGLVMLFACSVRRLSTRRAPYEEEKHQLRIGYWELAMLHSQGRL